MTRRFCVDESAPLLRSVGGRTSSAATRGTAGDERQGGRRGAGRGRGRLDGKDGPDETGMPALEGGGDVDMIMGDMGDFELASRSRSS